MEKEPQDKNLTEFIKLMRASKFTAARQLLPSPDVTDPPCWHLARLDLERLESRYPGDSAEESEPPGSQPIAALRHRNVITTIRPTEVGFIGHWIIMMTGFLPLVVGVLALEYPPLWFGVVLSLFGMGEIWFGKKVLEGWHWVPKVLRIHTLALLIIFALGFIAMFLGGENFWQEVGGRRGVILPYAVAAYILANVLTLIWLRKGNVSSYYGECRRKSDYQIASETELNPLKWMGIFLLILAAGAAFNFMGLDPKTRMAASPDPLVLPLELPGSDYLARIWIILYSLLFPYFNPTAQIVDINALVTAERIGCIFAFLLLLVAGWGLWSRKWWSWGMGIAMAVILAGSLGDIFRLMGNPNISAMTALDMLVNLAISAGLLWMLLRKGVKLALGVDADADLALSFAHKSTDGRKVK